MKFVYEGGKGGVLIQIFCECGKVNCRMLGIYKVVTCELYYPLCLQRGVIIHFLEQKVTRVYR